MIRRRIPRFSTVMAALVFVFLYAPIVLVLLNSFNADETLIGWGGFTLDWWDKAFTDPRVREDFLNSAIIAIASTVLSLIIAVSASVWARTASPRGRGLLDASTYLRIVLPEIVFALGLFLMLTQLDVPLGMTAVIIGHVVVNSAYATIIVQARMSTLSASLEQAAADLGATPWRTFRRVTLPLLVPGIVVATLLVFSFSFDNVITSQFLGGSNVETLPVLLLGLIRIEITPEVNAIGSGVMIITLVSALMAAVVALARPSGAGDVIGVGGRRQDG